MKQIVAMFSLSSFLLCSTAFAEQVNPRALDDKNTSSQQNKDSKGAKTKSMENATEQQSDPNVKSNQHPDKQKTGHDSGNAKGNGH
ncbi:hypothetical protein [Methylobacillus glycogenes]|uniref:hypothetical protein n=1 Tax=Methylobacillus glycogenes TaxID=406 RepID=UPI00046F6503|nr:hypothetical protein [Methylobacillus glycogenes]